MALEMDVPLAAVSSRKIWFLADIIASNAP